MIQQLWDYGKARRLNLYQLAVCSERGIQSVQCQPCNDCNNIYSITKVFLNTAIGMLLDEQRLQLDDSILSILQPYVDGSYAAVWDSVTIRNALAHRMGLEEGVIDIDRDDVRTYGTDDYLRYILCYPPKFAPGSYRKYTDCAHYLLSLVVEQITGVPADEFIRERILHPLEFQHTAWTRCPRNHTIGATGAYMRAEEIAKLGWLYVNAGTYDAKQLVSSDWVDQMEKEKFDLYPVKGTSFFHKGGIHGQMVLYSREKRLSVAWTGYLDDRDSRQLTEYVAQLAE